MSRRWIEKEIERKMDCGFSLRIQREALFCGVVLAILMMAAGWPSPASAAEAGEGPSRRVLIVSVDGLRPDLLLLANTPHIRSLVTRGSYTFWAQTTEMGITLPSHTSMVTGRKIVYHGIYWNGTSIPDGVEYRYPQVPTLFELASARGYSTAIVSGKLKFRTLAKPGTVNWLLLPEKDKEDAPTTAANAVRMIREHRPQVMLLHFADVDTAGHRDGWGSHEQLQAIEEADSCIGQVLNALKEQDLLDQTLIILSADHGGFGHSHHGEDPRGLHIPWIIAGPGVRQNYDLTLESKLIVRTYDTFATACAYLQIPLPKECDGRLVTEAFETSIVQSEGLEKESLPSSGTDARVIAFQSGASDSDMVYLIEPRARWQYLPGDAVAVDWTTGDQLASPWREGPAGLGYGDSDDQTELREMRGQTAVLYIRRAFTVESPLSNNQQLGLLVRYDDGFIAYLNGAEVLRVGVDAGRGPSAGPVRLHEAGEEFAYFPIPDASKHLRMGKNILAIEAYNSSKTSSDLTIDPCLVVGSTLGSPSKRLADEP